MTGFQLFKQTGKIVLSHLFLPQTKPEHNCVPAQMKQAINAAVLIIFWDFTHFSIQVLTRNLRAVIAR